MTKDASSPDIKAISMSAARWVARRDAGLSAPEQRELDAWLAADRRHRLALEYYARTWSVFDRAGRDGSAVSVVRIVGARGRRRRRRIGAAAAVLAVITFGSVLWLTQVPPRSEDVGAPVPTAMVRRPESRTLPDGSVIELRTGAAIAVDFGGPLRRVALLKGEAHFQVAKDSARPFVVSASGIETRAVGTAFSVEMGRNAVEVLVTEGRVAVSRGAATPKSADHPENPSAVPAGELGQLFVHAGQRVIVETAVRTGPLPVVAEVAQAEVAERLAWRNARLEFTGTPLAKAVTIINRSGGSVAGRPRVTLVIDPASPDLAAEPVSGLFRADNAETFVRMLELSLGIQAERRGADEIILRQPKP